MRIALALIAGLASAQTMPAWVGFGGSYTGSVSPHFAGWGAFAQPVNATVQAYSFTLGQTLVVDGKAAASITTGVDDVLKAIAMKKGDWTLHGIGTIGGASSTGKPATNAAAPASQTALATALGGGWMFRFKQKTWMVPAGFTLEGFALSNSVGTASKPSFLLGGGYTW